MKMTISSTQRPENGGIPDLSTLPDASDLDASTTVAEESTTSTHRHPSVLPDADEASVPEHLGTNSSITISDDEESTDQPCYSDPDDSEYHDSGSSTPVPSRQGATHRSCLPGAADSGFESESNTSIHANQHVIDEFSNLSDAFEPGSFDASQWVLTPTSQQLSFLSDASTFNVTTIKMEDTRASVPEESSVVSDSKEIESSGHVNERSNSEDVEPSKILTQSYRNGLL